MNRQGKINIGCAVILCVGIVIPSFAINFFVGLILMVLAFFIIRNVVKKSKYQDVNEKSEASLIQDSAKSNKKSAKDKIVDVEMSSIEKSNKKISDEDMENIVYKICDFYISLSLNHEFKNAFQDTIKLQFNATAIDTNDFAERFKIMYLIDITNCYLKLGKSIYMTRRTGLMMLFLYAKIYNSNILSMNMLNMVMTIENRKSIVKFYIQLKDNIEKNQEIEEVFYISKVLSQFNVELQKEFLMLLHQFSSIVVNVDGRTNDKGRLWMKKIMDLSNECDEKNKIIEKNISDETDGNVVELESLIGLKSVKDEINTLSNFLKIQKHRELQGLKISNPSYHCVFTGNPGTGKTTVARILAGIYKELGIVKKGHLVETDRSGLVAEYVGQTAVKTNKIIDKALDGVLFIDEAYSLIGGGESDYGKEAIATLLKRMEDDRDRLVVILAGYSSEMKDFIDSNSGLKSRFNRYIEFPDYSANELYEIFESNLKKYEYKISQTASEFVKNYLKNAVENKDKNFGNARFVRNYFEKVIENQSNRLSKNKDLTKETLSEIIDEDVIVE